MSNAHVNKKHKVHGGGSPKMVGAGFDLSGDATNCIPGTKVTTKPLGPSANAASINAKK